MKKLLLVGGGGHCKACIDVIEKTGAFEIVGIVDNQLTASEKVCDYAVIGSDKDLPNLLTKANYALVTIGQLRNTERRIVLFEYLIHLGYQMPTIISPTAYIAKEVAIGMGTIVMHNVLINRAANVGQNCIINTKALIEHDAIIADHCHISTAATVNGDAIVKTRSFVGSNAVVVHTAVVPEDSFIKANQVFKDK